ncbi:hypothetical protein SDC9_94906 [bioreactor metagenome]|uniref:Uncharacterized protein n=1 Tax=bioreactor metagenome TaxID=1076179 RepID=A0A645A527_9ZZZZ
MLALLGKTYRILPVLAFFKAIVIIHKLARHILDVGRPGRRIAPHRLFHRQIIGAAVVSAGPNPEYHRPAAVTQRYAKPVVAGVYPVCIAEINFILILIYVLQIRYVHKQPLYIIILCPIHKWPADRNTPQLLTRRHPCLYGRRAIRVYQIISIRLNLYIQHQIRWYCHRYHLTAAVVKGYTV